jgi:hypothetical protein
MNTESVEVVSQTVSRDIVWRGICRARVDVLGDDGRAVPRCRVLFAPYGTSEGDLEAALSDDSSNGPACARAVTNDRGACEVTVAPNIYTVRIVPPPGALYQPKLIKQVSISADWSRTVKLSPKDPEPQEPEQN